MPVQQMLLGAAGKGEDLGRISRAHNDLDPTQSYNVKVEWDQDFTHNNTPNTGNSSSLVWATIQKNCGFFMSGFSTIKWDFSDLSAAWIYQLSTSTYASWRNGTDGTDCTGCTAVGGTDGFNPSDAATYTDAGAGAWLGNDDTRYLNCAFGNGLKPSTGLPNGFIVQCYHQNDHAILAAKITINGVARMYLAKHNIHQHHHSYGQTSRSIVLYPCNAVATSFSYITQNWVGQNTSMSSSYFSDWTY